MSRYAKFYTALLPWIVYTLSLIGQVISDASVTSEEILSNLGLLLAAIAVRTIPNTPPAGQPADPRVSEQHRPATS